MNLTLKKHHLKKYEIKIFSFMRTILTVIGIQSGTKKLDQTNPGL